jgi:plasmid stabilization system protein ParE
MTMTEKLVAVEFATCDETIRTCAIDDLIGLEHPNAAEACAAYRRAAVEALENDPRAGRLTAETPRGQRILHSQWAGTYFKYSAGAIGTMGDLTEDEKAAVSDANDAGAEAAQKVVDDAGAEVGESYGGIYYVRKGGDPIHLTAEELQTLLAAVMTGMNAVGGKTPKSVAESLDTLISKLEDAADMGIEKWPEWK